MTDIVWVLGLAYLCGSIPFAFLIGKLIGGLDIRTVGSGNVGATNIGRTLGKKWGILVLLLDALKGLLPVGFVPELIASPESEMLLHLKVVAALGAILGHMCPVWLGFKGGKGVATALGVVVMLAPWATLAALIAFLVVFGVKRIVSLASLIAVTVFGVTQLILLGSEACTEANWSLAAFSVAVPALIIWKHRSNIGRLLRGEEAAFTSKSKEEAETDSSAAQ